MTAFLKWKMCFKQESHNWRKKNMLLGHWYSDWCEVTPLMVISCRGPSSLCCFYSGRRSALAESSPPFSIQRKQTVKGGPTGAKRGPALLHVFPAFNSLFICSSQWPQSRAKGRLLKYCCSMVSFLPVNKRQLSRLFCSLTCAGCLFPCCDPS